LWRRKGAGHEGGHQRRTGTGSREARPLPKPKWLLLLLLTVVLAGKGIRRKPRRAPGRTRSQEGSNCSD